MITKATARSPLHELRVVEMAPFLPGPLCAQILADLGADVTKVERPGGDPGRGLASGFFPVANRNKKNVRLDLATEPGRASFHDLATQADVIIEGSRPGVADRLGVSYQDVRPHNPEVIYCSISGYGQAGPRATEPGHDINYLGSTGALTFPGRWGDDEPARPGLPMADLAAASYAAIAVLAALEQRRRTGEGAYLDLAIADVSLAWASVRAGDHLDADGSDRRHLFPTNDVFECSDGRWLAVGAIEERFWRSLREIVAAHDDAILDARFDSDGGRREHGDTLKSLLERVFAERPAASWSRDLQSVDVPATVVRSVAEAVNDAQVKRRGIVQELDGQRHVVFPAIVDGLPLGSLRSTVHDDDRTR